ncbi:TonB-dependent hemoglobin/transferrin/lactoferrin family receptor [Bradyrhizobium prioriisuperbiae]|uniref:TonB-dependent hemoglobin/transferrin/lactoferrin family receptor n=1 Tax=Bradyrhizobium prioriisuperbiae TaxID=2854389 RepID=UPI0028E1AD65|nr:TonB-dependent hemoglobin/transferrin/lactoferrin family receptor [Bradyrhizobium prioritasuperba]
MANRAGSTHVLVWGTSVLALSLGGASLGRAQSAPAQQPQAPRAEQAKPDAPKPAKRRTAKRQPAPQPTEAVRNANAQAGSSNVQTLDTITVSASKTEERAIDALAPVSVVTAGQIQGLQPNRVGDVLRTLPGVSLQDRGDDASTSVNIRGLQDFGRVAVLVDGARQNYQRTGHNANGSFFLDPELIGGIDVVRGPTSNIYGSGAIGGLVSFRTKDIEDVLRPGERWGVDLGGTVKSNGFGGVGSMFGGIRVDPTLDVFGGAVYRNQGNYKDGAGTEIGNTGNELAAGMLKVTTRPADGHTVKIGGIFQDYNYTIGQLNRGSTTTSAPPALLAGTSVYDSNAKNYTGTINWRYSKPDDNLFDWNATLYANRTENDQVKTYNNRITVGGFPPACTLANPGNNISGCVGDNRSYLLNTAGIDLNNTSRFAIGEWRNALTYGVDGFLDNVSTFDKSGNSNVTTPSGQRTVSGAFVQWKANYSTWLEVIGAARYDRYKLESGGTTSSGDRLSPKITVGITPVPGFTPYVSYAEGYRAPSITETLIFGTHSTGGGPIFFNCPDGNSGLFCFLRNPNLRPEVGKNKEIGVNLKYDGIFTAGDSFRAKLNVFRNDIDDYIDLVASPPEPSLFFGIPSSKYYQYQNITNARIQGFEGEISYDAGSWFAAVAGNVMEGKNTATNIGLATLIQPKKVVSTAGLRFLDRRLTVSAQWISFASNTDVPASYIPATSGDIVNLYLAYQPTADITLNFSIDNIANRYYRPYAIPGPSADGQTVNDILWTSPGPGITYKGGLKVHFGGA